MDLGLDLDDDDIFDNCNGRTKERCKDPYSVRLCPELWFNTVNVSGLSTVDAQTVTKYQGDVAYQEEQYESALLTFQHCLDLLQPNNVSMKRGVEEDSARCYLRLSQLDSALECARNVVALAQNFEQVTAVLVLLLDIYEAAGKTTEMLCTLKKLLLLHPNNSRLWTQLGDLYSPKPSCAAQNSDPSRTDCKQMNGVVSDVNSCRCSQEKSYTTQDRELQSVEYARVVECREKLKTDDWLVKNPPTEDSRTSNGSETVCSGRFTVEKKGRIIVAADTGDFSYPVLNRFESMSCADDLKHGKEMFLRRDRLAICLTCFVSARLLLRSVHCRLNSFAKVKNQHDQLKVDSRLDSLLAESDAEEDLQSCSEFLKVALNLTEADESMASTNKICDMTPRQILCEDERSTAAFDRKWFSWMKEDASCHEQFEFKAV